MATVRVQVDGDLAGVVAQAAAGDEGGFARIIQAHHDDMTRVCFVICGDLDIADEAVQAAWPIAWRKLGSLREPERLRPWLASIAANEASACPSSTAQDGRRAFCDRCGDPGHRSGGTRRRSRRPTRWLGSIRRPGAAGSALRRGVRLDRARPGDRALAIIQLRPARSPLARLRTELRDD